MEIFDETQIIKNLAEKENKKISYIKCTYEVKEDKENQIINDRSENYVNEEVASKIKILNGDKKENLIFKKKFDHIGINNVIFIIE